MFLSAVLKRRGTVSELSEAVGPRWKHENAIIASLPVGIANKGAWHFQTVLIVESLGHPDSQDVFKWGKGQPVCTYGERKK